MLLHWLLSQVKLLAGRNSIPSSGNPYCGVRLSTVDLLVKITCFVKKEKSALKVADLN
jgi:hypothetical protein